MKFEVLKNVWTKLSCKSLEFEDLLEILLVVKYGIPRTSTQENLEQYHEGESAKHQASQ